MERRSAKHTEERKARLWNEPFTALRDGCLSLFLALTVMKTGAAAVGERHPTEGLSLWDDGGRHHTQPVPRG